MGFNHRPRPYKGGALSTELRGQTLLVYGEPASDTSQP